MYFGDDDEWNFATTTEPGPGGWSRNVRKMEDAEGRSDLRGARQTGIPCESHFSGSCLEAGGNGCKDDRLRISCNFDGRKSSPVHAHAGRFNSTTLGESNDTNILEGKTLTMRRSAFLGTTAGSSDELVRESRSSGCSEFANSTGSKASVFQPDTTFRYCVSDDIGFGRGTRPRVTGFGGTQARGAGVRCKLIEADQHSQCFANYSQTAPELPVRRSIVKDSHLSLSEKLLRRLPSTYVPVDEKVEDLFNKRVEKGQKFMELNHEKVTLVEGLRGRAEKGRKIRSLEELNLPEPIVRNLSRAGYTTLTPIQQYAFPAALKGRDIMACSKTGSGKTAAFLLPVITDLIHSGNQNNLSEFVCLPRCLIIAPTRELCVQIYNEARKFAHETALRIACVYGGTALFAQLRTLARGATVLVATVGRLEQFIAEAFVSLRKVKYLILDEADRMLEPCFKESLDFILYHHTMPTKVDRQTFMFSATFAPPVQMIASHLLKSDFLLVVVGGISVANKFIKQDFIECRSLSEKKSKLLALLGADLRTYEANKRSEVFKQKTLVFVNRRHLADSLGVLLCEIGLPAITIHGDRYQQQREEALNAFRKGHKPVLIATAVGERGLDIKGVDHVINYDLPFSEEEYINRIGRTGRAGNPGRATSLYYSSEDKCFAGYLVKVLTDVGQDVPKFLANEMNSYMDVIEEEDW